MTEELKLSNCPSCKFTMRDYNRINKMAHTIQNAENYFPIIYEDRLINNWVIECQNCGLIAIFGQGDKEEDMILWNELSERAFK